MNRREFIALTGGAAVWPVAAGGQQHQKLRDIGVLMGFSRNHKIRCVFELYNKGSRNRD